MATRKGGLGKGLDAIFMDNDTENKNNVVTLKISEIEPNREQPRKEFDEESLSELASSISKYGVLQPLLVHPLPGGGYQIVAGERRWRACRMAGVSEVPVVIRELNDLEIMEIALIENLQREDLTAIEEALGYKTLMDTYKLTQDEVAKSVGKSRPSVTNALRLLNLPQEVINLLKEEKISAGHARALLSLNDDKLIIEFAKLITDKGISVREIEKLIKKQQNDSKNRNKKENKSDKKRNLYFDEMEIALNAELCRKVSVINRNGDKGTLQIDFYSKEELRDLAYRLAKNN